MGDEKGPWRNPGAPAVGGRRLRAAVQPGRERGARGARCGKEGLGAGGGSGDTAHRREPSHVRATEDRDRKSRRSVGREGVEQTSGRALGHGERGRVFEGFFCKRERRQVVAVTG